MTLKNKFNYSKSIAKMGEKIIKDIGKDACDNFFKHVNVVETHISTGGSHNIVFICTLKRDPQIKFVIKLLVNLYLSNTSTIINNESNVEVSILKLLNEEFVNKNITPCIVSQFDIKQCSDIDVILPKDCDKFVKNYVSSIDYDYNLCIIRKLHNLNLINKSYILSIQEYGKTTLQKYLLSIIKMSDINDEIILQIILRSIMFQLIYTLAVIQDKYPSFRHNDLHAGNILVSQIPIKDENEYFKFIYKDKTFYMPNTGIIIKLIDFGRSNIKDIFNNDYIDNSIMKVYTNIDASINRKSDLLMLINDLYEIYEMPQNNKDFLKQFVSHKIINNQIAKTLFLNEQHPLLKKMYTPNDFLLKSDIFNIYTEVPKKKTIIEPVYKYK